LSPSASLVLAVAVTVSLVRTVAGDSVTLLTTGAVFEIVMVSDDALALLPSLTVTVQVMLSPALVKVDRLLDVPRVVPLRVQA